METPFFSSTHMLGIHTVVCVWFCIIYTFQIISVSVYNKGNSVFFLERSELFITENGVMIRKNRLFHLVDDFLKGV